MSRATPMTVASSAAPLSDAGRRMTAPIASLALAPIAARGFLREHGDGASAGRGVGGGEAAPGHDRHADHRGSNRSSSRPAPAVGDRAASTRRPAIRTGRRGKCSAGSPVAKAAPSAPGIARARSISRCRSCNASSSSADFPHRGRRSRPTTAATGRSRGRRGPARPSTAPPDRTTTSSITASDTWMTTSAERPRAAAAPPTLRAEASFSELSDVEPSTRSVGNIAKTSGARKASATRTRRRGRRGQAGGRTARSQRRGRRAGRPAAMARPTQPAGDADDQALGDDLPDDPAAGGAERGAHRQLLPAADQPGDQQVRDVGAGQDAAAGPTTVNSSDRTTHVLVPARASRVVPTRMSSRGWCRGIRSARRAADRRDLRVGVRQVRAVGQQADRPPSAFGAGRR